VTGGRLEVTALGEEVNEGARLEQAATRGELLASRALVARLDEHDLAALEIHPEAITYRPLEELPSARGKAIRDAGALGVVDLASVWAPHATSVGS
jgi:class 3 adenylate cyclase